MALKIVILACVVAAVCGQTPFYPSFYSSPTPYAAEPSAVPFRAARPYSYYPGNEEEYGPAHYQFQYEINAPETGDSKSQQETRDGDAVSGSYSIVQPDGLLRIVEYSDQGAGFIASVRYEPVGANIPQTIPVQGRYVNPSFAPSYATPFASAASPTPYAGLV